MGEGLNLSGLVACFLDQLAAGSFGLTLVTTSWLIANDAGGQLDRACMDRNPILLNQEKFLLVGHGDDDRRARRVGAFGVFPMAFFDECEKFTGEQCGFGNLIHFVSKMSMLCTTAIPARFISSIAFFTSSGRRFTPRPASSIRYVLNPFCAASSPVNFTQ